MPLNEKIRDPLTDQLFDAILLLEDREECYRFFEDIATIAEIKALAQRLEVARLLEEGYTYEEVAAQTGASSATISRVKRALVYGADGYKIILERMKRQSSGSPPVQAAERGLKPGGPGQSITPTRRPGRGE